ncbi:GNAT family N-acetyltransferase [Leifsonia sp. 21MFCrub1.1]|uniref:GNAT family N-acetyltransferase n=1 Tax=Leifsonia sp. 21MFCrub1.1 TaxID=1798223 RepID=UPI00089294A4|nr:GNAT family N-acetyltransferase [Leifsonia sp. 21MFCrub1.1]SEA56662.1 Ribosomal protein S18 acetylase RimI [Leifsonia sp. 21MFCrub1.1]
MTDDTLSPLSERVAAPPTYRPQHPLIAEWRPATAADVDAVHEVYRAIDTADHPNYLTNREQVEEELGFSFIDLEQDTLLAIAADGRVAAVGIVMEPPRQESLVREFMNGGVHPEFRERGIGRELLAWQRARGEQKLAASDKRLPGWLVGYADERAPGRQRLLEAGGFEVVRYFQTMERDLADPVPDVTPVGDVRIEPYRDELSAAVHAARDDAFRDHWGSQPLSDEQFHGLVSGTFAADLSYVAMIDGDVAGIVLTDVAEEDWPGQGFTGSYVSTVAVTRPYRGRRIAPSLLRAVLEASAARGLEKVVLDVDAENPTGALGLYTGMGFVTSQQEVGLVRAY